MLAIDRVIASYGFHFYKSSGGAKVATNVWDCINEVGVAGATMNGKGKHGGLHNCIPGYDLFP